MTAKWIGRRGGIVVVALAAAAALAGSLTAQRLVGAEASHESPCANSDISNAVFEVTGAVPLGRVCNSGLYNNGQWSNYNELKGHVTQVMDRCDGISNRYLVQAVIEVTGVPPSGGVCDRQVYEDWVDDTFGTSYSINWNQYKGSTTTVESVFDAVNLTFSTCHEKWISQAVIEHTSQYPDIAYDERPAGAFNDGGVSGQCNPWLYDHGVVWNYPFLSQQVELRADASQVAGCDPWIDQAIGEMTAGWNATSEDCDIRRYKAGHWSSYDELKRRIYHSWFCNDPWVGQVYYEGLGRRVSGRGSSGECNLALYGNPDPSKSPVYYLWQSGSIDTSTQEQRFQRLEQRLGVTQSALSAVDMTIASDGDATIGGVDWASDKIFIGNLDANRVWNLDGNIITNSIISEAGGAATELAGNSVIASDGASVIASDGASLIGQAGTNVIASGGGNLIGQAGTN